MKTLKIQIKLISLFLSMLILFQSCVTYKKTSHSLDEIVELKTRVKLVTLDNQLFKFKKIEKRDNNYCGIKYSKNRSKDIILYPNDIQEIKVYDGVLSTILTVVALSPVIVIIISIAVNGGLYFGL